ncbi:heavy-metal-associated domain-containing protein [bacterium SCSIO 12741]|nr:heavy-metal-associated domain-containing protein [bacterium SCSIO 12741]
MKILLNLSLFLAFMGFTALSYGQSKMDTLNVKTKINCSHCQVCGSCGKRFEGELSFGKGVKQVQYNPSDTTITIIYRSGKTTPDELRQEIAKLGFPADNIPADPAGYAKLDACCKKD